MDPDTKRHTKEENIIGIKELRENMGELIERVRDGETFTVLKRSQPVFRIGPLSKEKLEERWETVVDFTQAKQGGVEIDELLSRL